MTRPGVRMVVSLIAILLAAVVAVTWATSREAIPWTVDGPSMIPTLRPGDRVLVSLRAYRDREPETGDVVLLAGPSDIPMVKRIARRDGSAVEAPADLLRAAPGEKTYWVVGDNPSESYDSRRFGEVPRYRIVGRVVLRYWPLSRLGSIR